MGEANKVSIIVLLIFAAIVGLYFLFSVHGNSDGFAITGGIVRNISQDDSGGSMGGVVKKVDVEASSDVEVFVVEVNSSENESLGNYSD